MHFFAHSGQAFYKKRKEQNALKNNFEYRKKDGKSKTPTEAVLEMLKKPYNDLDDNVIADPNGSYTGICTPKSEIPVQDVDDL